VHRGRGSAVLECVPLFPRRASGEPPIERPLFPCLATSTSFSPSLRRPVYHFRRQPPAQPDRPTARQPSASPEPLQQERFSLLLARRRSLPPPLVSCIPPLCVPSVASLPSFRSLLPLLLAPLPFSVSLGRQRIPLCSVGPPRRLFPRPSHPVLLPRSLVGCRSYRPRRVPKRAKAIAPSQVRADVGRLLACFLPFVGHPSIHPACLIPSGRRLTFDEE
jgi:hypothetical protein